MSRDREHHQCQEAGFEHQIDDGRVRISPFGDWRHSTIAGAYQKFLDIKTQVSGHYTLIDCDKITHFDTAGAWVLRQFAEHSQKGFELVNAKAEIVDLFNEVPAHVEVQKTDKTQARTNPIIAGLDVFGRAIDELRSDAISALNILGAMIAGGQMKKGHGSTMSLAPIVTQMDYMGVRAIPIIILMSLSIGAIIAQQSAFQLRFVGLEVLAVDFVSVLQLREIGVLLTSIMVAGRSGSAITAEIGSMKMREEIDALKVMGLNPIAVLVVPRLIALVLVLPLLTILANFASLLGAALVLKYYSGVSFVMFWDRMVNFIDYTTISAGIIKAPFMALIIGVMAAVEGMKVGGSAESLGRRVTASVVKAIFVVILVDGLFAMFYAAIDF